jgi:hypothetical protein
MGKTYLVTNTLETRFPYEFLNSRDKRYILFQMCRCNFKNADANDYLTSDIQVHCDFIERDHYLDYFAGFSNTILTKYKKWEVKNVHPTFKIWFTDMEGNQIPVVSKAEEQRLAEIQEANRLNAEQTKELNLSQGFDSDPVIEVEETPSVKLPYISSFVLELMLIF